MMESKTTLVDLRAIRYWVDRLWGISEGRQEAARDQVLEWDIGPVARELSPVDADASVAAVMLSEGVASLIARGIEPPRLLRKLRKDPQFWSAWAEIRAASLLCDLTFKEGEVALEPDRKKGAHADFAFQPSPNAPRLSIEFKALGLSDEDLAFCRGVAKYLPKLIPPVGIVTTHTWQLQSDVKINRRRRRALQRDARSRVKNLHPVAHGLSAAVAVAHQREPDYVHRLTGRLSRALRQLPQDEETYVAFYWTNGAPIRLVAEALRKAEVPDFVAGVILVGSVGIPGRMDNYTQVLFSPFGSPEKIDWNSAGDVNEAKMVMEAVEDSAGVRPTYVRVPWDGRLIDFLFRNGSRRIDPFNLVLVRDPMGRPVSEAADPSPGG